MTHDTQPATADEWFARGNACAERGEFHTFVWGGPMFAKTLQVEVGETVEREGFVFTDVLPGRSWADPLSARC